MAKFNKEMDRYLKDRTSRRVDRIPKKKQEKVPELKEGEVYVEKREPGFWARIFGRKELNPDEEEKLEEVEEEIYEIEEAETESTDPDEIEALEEARESALDRFFGMFRLFKRRHDLEEKMEVLDEAEEEGPTIDEEVRAVLKITYKWLNKLPKRQKDAFKESEDFKQYKEILKKFEIAK